MKLKVAITQCSRSEVDKRKGRWQSHDSDKGTSLEGLSEDHEAMKQIITKTFIANAVNMFAK